MDILISALLLGLMGSFHCAGMCGPIAVALPLPGNTVVRKIAGGALYNVGRTVTYGILGLLFGLLGKGLNMLGFQQIVSIVMGSIMILSVLFPSIFKSRYRIDKRWVSWAGKLKLVLGKMFSIRSYSSLFIIGILNGLLPCGLVYMAVAGAIGTGEVILGSFYMIAFGLGTVPVMLTMSLAGNIMSAAIRRRVNKVIPLLIILVGIFFILRGLSLGIPFLSPPREKIEMKFQRSLESEQASLNSESRVECCH